MAVDDRLWTTVAPSPFPHEQEAFDFLKRHAKGVVGAWSNFEFIEPGGKVYEVDLLLLTLTELFLIEVKSWSGVLEGTANSLVRYYRGNPTPQPVANPLKLTNAKARVFKSMLADQKALRKHYAPYVQPVVFFNNVNLEMRIPPEERPFLFTRHEIIEALAPKPHDRNNPRKCLDKIRATALGKAFKELGLHRPGRRSLKVGEWVIKELLDEGDMYQDHLAHHQSLGETFRRIRIFAVPPKGTAEQRASARRAAEREFRLADSMQHPGILSPLNLVESELGPALVYYYDPKAQPLDRYLAAEDSRLSLDQRLALVRQLADVLRYTHARRIYHRGLAPQSVMVWPSGELKVMDWKTGMELGGTAGTSRVGDLMTMGAKAYLAPEAFLHASQAAGNLVDVFGLGAVAYFVLTGVPPAETHAQLYSKLQEQRGLQLSTVADGFAPELEALIERCTHPRPQERPASIQEVLELLDRIPTAVWDEEPELTDPLQAQAGDLLLTSPGGGSAEAQDSAFLVRRRLGKGAMALALEVERDGAVAVLKVAHSREHTEALLREAQALEALDHPHIVRLYDTVEIDGRLCLLLQHAGSETLAHRLAEKGPPGLEILGRWGRDLLKALVHLEERGIRHRDLKPANLGVAELGENSALHLVLFDFSLAGVPDENLEAGTRDYLDPFLQNQRRWDQSAERYSAGVTLHEMVTNVLPVWGDGTSHPGLDDTVPLCLAAERMEPTLRDGLVAFFSRALSRDRKARFHNAVEMLAAWTELFRQPVVSEPQQQQSAEELERRLQQADPSTSLAALGLDLRLVRAGETMGLSTLGGLLETPSNALYTAAGIDHQTRKRLAELQAELAERFGHDPLRQLTELSAPEPATDPAAQAVDGPDVNGAPDPPPRTSKGAPRPYRGGLELILRQVLDAGRGGASEDKELYLGLGLPPQESPWPELSRVCTLTGLEPLTLARKLPGWRRAWVKLEDLELLRDELYELLVEGGTVALAEEAALHLLTRRGALSNEPQQRRQMAHALARAAAEAEQTSADPRFRWERVGAQPVLALQREGALYLRRLAQVADRCAQQKPLLAPQRAAELLRSVPAPEGAEALSSHRLLQLAAACSQGAAVSSREELYPKGMEAARALELAHGALLGTAELSPEQIQRRVAGRYPEAQPLPDRPGLDAVLQAVEPDLVWDEGQERYRRQVLLLRSTSGSSHHFTRYPTSDGSVSPSPHPDQAEAYRFQERLSQALTNHDFLALMVGSRSVDRAQEELLRRFELTHFDLNSLLLTEMRAAVERKRARWESFLLADTGTNPKGWGVLTRQLVPEAVAAVEATLTACPNPMLLTDPGLLGRYDKLGLLERLRDLAGAREGLASVWLLLPADDLTGAPNIDGRPVPLIHAGQVARIPRSWMSNADRTSPRHLGA